MRYSSLALLLLFSPLLLAYPLFDFDGPSAQIIDPCDDSCYLLLNMPVPFTFYGRNFSSVYINNNGVLSFAGSVPGFVPVPFPLSGNNPAFAPFWVDVDTRNGPIGLENQIYGELVTAGSPALGQIQAAVRSYAPGMSTFTAVQAVIATYYEVGYYGAHIDRRDTFQAVLATDGTDCFGIFVYPNGAINYLFGDASINDYPNVGFDAGDGVHSLSLLGSFTDQAGVDVASMSNVGQPGLWIFQVDSDVITANACPSQVSGGASWGQAGAGTTESGSCINGYSGAPSQRTCHQSGVWLSVQVPCDGPTCPDDHYSHAQWPQSAAGVVIGTCDAGYVGSPARYCYSGTWSTSVSPGCHAVTCASTTEGNAYWSSGLASSTITGQCLNGYTGSPTRPCQTDGTFGAISNPCQPVTCPVDTYAFADWAVSPYGMASGTCINGYSGTISRQCQANGAWSTSLTGRCSLNQCAALSNDNNANWPVTNALASSTGTCIAPYAGTATRPCNGDGTFGAVTSPCTYVTCPVDTYAFANWAVSPYGVATGTCINGYSGTITRQCQANGAWSTSLTGRCSLNHCAALSNDNNANWPLTNALANANGTCIAPFSGSPSRPCNGDGTFGTVVNPCIQTSDCPLETYGRATFPQTTPGGTATGTCVAKSATKTGNPPTRKCNVNGQWQTLVQNNCYPIQCPETTDFANAHFPATNYGTLASGTCLSGTGSPTMMCDTNANWSTLRGTCA